MFSNVFWLVSNRQWYCTVEKHEQYLACSLGCPNCCKWMQIFKLHLGKLCNIYSFLFKTSISILSHLLAMNLGRNPSYTKHCINHLWFRFKNCLPVGDLRDLSTILYFEWWSPIYPILPTVVHLANFSIDTKNNGPWNMQLRLQIWLFWGINMYL